MDAICLRRVWKLSEEVGKEDQRGDEKYRGREALKWVHRGGHAGMGGVKHSCSLVNTAQHSVGSNDANATRRIVSVRGRRVAVRHNRYDAKQGNKFRPRDATPPWHVMAENALRWITLVMFGSSPFLVMLDGPLLGIAPGPATAAPPQDDPDPEKIPGTGSSTPEPLDNAQIELMRKRVLELIVSGASKINTSSSEKELLEMVHFLPCLLCDEFLS